MTACSMPGTRSSMNLARFSFPYRRCRMQLRLRVIASAVVCAACSTSESNSADAPDGSRRAQLGTWGVDLANRDTTVAPGDDFFRHVNGKWLDRTKIPPDRASIGSFDELSILSENRSKEILAGLDTGDPATGEERKLRDLYHTYMDSATIEKLGMGPASYDLSYFAGLQTLNDVAHAMGSVRRMTDGPFGFFVSVDDKNSNAYSALLFQGGLGMPDRDYYLLDDKEIVATREAYKKHLATVLSLTNTPDAEKRAAAVFALEDRIAKAHWPAADRRDADKVYNPMTVTQLEALAPQFPWRIFLQEHRVPLTNASGERNVVVAEKSAFPKLAAIFAATPVAVWRDYLTAHYLHNTARYQPQSVFETNFAFYGKVLNGQEQPRPRPTRAFYVVDEAMGEALGKLYVARYFPADAKAKAQTLVSNLLKAMEADIHKLAWMSKPTREQALAKLRTFNPKVGYPDTWRDYGNLVVVRDSLLATARNIAEFQETYRVRRLDDPVDKAEWDVTPPTVNAYYNTAFNEIVFPAAILQPPFFDPNADAAVNYGAIGGVIGHEISHGFDDQGSKYDAAGNLRNWWTPADRAEFDKRSAALGDQYSGFEALPGLNVNGKLTMGENIGDLAGVTIAYAAYKLSLGDSTPPTLDGYSGDQRFFLGWAQAWRSNTSDQLTRQLVLSNPHSPDRFRVVGVVRNIDPWYPAFNVTAANKDYLPPEKRVRLW